MAWLVYLSKNEIHAKEKRFLGVYTNFKKAYERFVNDDIELRATYDGVLDTYNKACKARIDDVHISKERILFARCKYYPKEPEDWNVTIIEIKLNQKFFL